MLVPTAFFELLMLQTAFYCAPAANYTHNINALIKSKALHNRTHLDFNILFYPTLPYVVWSQVHQQFLMLGLVIEASGNVQYKVNNRESAKILAVICDENVKTF